MIFFYPKYCGNWATTAPNMGYTYHDCTCVGLKMSAHPGIIGGDTVNCWGIIVSRSCYENRFTEEQGGFRYYKPCEFVTTTTIPPTTTTIPQTTTTIPSTSTTTSTLPVQDCTSFSTCSECVAAGCKFCRNINNMTDTVCIGETQTIIAIYTCKTTCT